MARRRFQKGGWLRVKNGSWLLTYKAYHVGGNSRPTVKVGVALRHYEKHQQTGKWRATGPILNRDGLNPKQAERLAWDQYLSRADQIAVKPRQTMSVADFWDENYWPYAVHTRRLDASTQGQYEALWRKWIKPVVGDVALVDVGLEHVEAILRQACDAGKSDATVLHVRKVGSALFTRAMDCEYYDRRNPFQRVRLHKPEPAHETFALSPEQARLVLVEINADYRPLVETALLTGMNVAELLGLRWGDIAGGSISVRRHFYRGHFGTLKTGNRRREIPVCDRLARVLTGGPADGVVFPASNGHPLNEQNIRRRHLKPLGEKLGLPGSLGWHVFRHSFATWLEDCGVREFDRRVLMGQADRSITDRYTHEDRERLRDAVERVAARIAESPAHVVEIRRAG